MKLAELVAIALATLAACGTATAQQFEVLGVSGAIKSRLTEGLAWRVDQPDRSRAIAKNAVDPKLCGFGDADSCYSFNGDQSNNARLLAGRGTFFGANRDDGDQNYHAGDLASAVTKLSSELSLSYEDWTFKAGALGYFDPVNHAFTSTHWDDPVDPRIGRSYQPHRTLRNGEIADNAGRSWLLKDALLAGKFALAEHEFHVTAGYQHIRWGESTLVALNSLSEINAPDVRLLYQPGTQIAEIFRPTPAVLLSTPVADGLSLDLVYLFGWDAVHLPKGGELYAPYDIFGQETALLSLGQFHEDPNCQQRLPGIGGQFSDTCLTVPFDSHTRARSQGQFGGKLSWFADFNGGTEFDFYAMNYHSRLPYLSFRAGRQTCIAETTTEIVQAIADCKGFRILSGGLEAAPIDSIRGFADYPEDILMLGASFNTNIGKWSLAGELSWRPNLPLQIEASDLLFAAAQPALPAHDICLGAGATVLGVIGLPGGAPSACAAPDLGHLANAAPYLAGIPASPRGQAILQQLGQNPNATYVIPGRRTAIPDNVSVYRGQAIQAGQYVPGYERVNALQFDFTGIRAFGASDNPIGADQVLLIAELGLSWFPDLPPVSRLQFEAGDANDTHRSPGADGSGDPAGTTAGRTPQGSYAASRFTPTMQTGGFATELSTGYRLILRLEYDNLFGRGWTWRPQMIWAHDVYGRTPLPVQNFVQGSKTLQLMHEVEFSSQWTASLFYVAYTGGGSVNYLRDRDSAGLVLQYSF